jgi:hypothetical protein
MPQIQVSLTPDAHQRLKRLKARLSAPYSAIVASGLAALETAPDLVPRVVYGALDAPGRAPWKRRARELRKSGDSFATIAKRLFDEGLAAGDGHPLAPSTVRGMLARSAGE